MIRKVILGISGGVDSAVSAYLLKSKGFQVQAVFLKNWNEIDETGKCSGEADFADAEYVCDYLGIPLHQMNFEKHYWNQVFENFLNDYSEGLTPNPDILCNKNIKFNLFFKQAVEKFRGDAFATGHYARTSFGSFLEKFEPNKKVKLLQAVDSFKDQTFFLSQISQEALRRTMFPVGNLQKSQVKEIASQLGWKRILEKRESVGVCFVGRRNFQDFIAEYIDDQPGNFVDFDTGVTVGTHRGIHHWTLGQGCNLGGFKKPYFVHSKDKLTNRIYVVAGTDHKTLKADTIFTSEAIWINKPEFRGNIFKCKFRFQHTKPLTNCIIYQLSDGKLFVKLEKALRAITPGQYAVFYTDDECLGSARIRRPLQMFRQEEVLENDEMKRESS
ncbi:mitochondrial tRNA-specific 2-thiouridylase 1 [Culicoides brevitarsis]|uniref:mitochondrial tRNA-specific 2-thiouridylase 1 n=1 Tax=Culicoides brevitarsis TaxID=469753 RepID=UPI00307C1290